MLDFIVEWGAEIWAVTATALLLWKWNAIEREVARW